MAVMMREDTSSLPPRYVVDTYRQAYATVHGRDPIVRYMGNQWYSVDGETVHRATLMQEITRLNELTQRAQQPIRKQDRSILNKLINKLRNL